MADSLSSLLIIEPNDSLVLPYGYISELYPNIDKMKRVSSTVKALDYLSEQTPDLVMLSASFSYVEQLEVLEKVKNLSKAKLIPVIIVVDFSQPLNSVLGTSWGGKMGLICSTCNRLEARSAFERVMDAN
jgi:PleD family two-component response regulator